jgi:uncharacterized membrane protein YhhN
MKKTYLKYLLLLVPTILAYLALNGFGFFFKSGTAIAGSLILLFFYFIKPKQNKDVWMIIGAFLFSIAADWFLSNMKGDSGMFVTGIVLYFVAHVGYLAFALFNGKVNKLFTGLLLAGFLVFYSIFLFPVINGGVMKIAVLIYLLISCVSLGAAVGLTTNAVVKWSYSFGIVLILFSDTIISFKEFVGYTDLNYLILPTYYAAHLAIIFTLIKRFNNNKI